MNRTFLTTMREATQLTRRGELGAATRLIQSSLRRPGLATKFPDANSADERTPNLDVLRLPGPRPMTAEPARSPARSTPPEIRQARLRRPLGEVVRILRQFRRNQFLRQPPKQRGPVPVPDGAQFIERDFACLAGRRTYKLYVPSRAADRATGLLVMLHGCTQDPDDFARGTRMGAIAEKRGLLIAYPAQSRAANPSLCWNWFQTQHQRRGAGEPAIIAGLTREVMAEFGLKQAFVAGLSAGGAMAAVMASAYPDLYDAVGIHSGLAAGSANDVVSAFAAMREGPDRIRARQAGTTRRIRTIVFHGDSDPTVHSTNGDLIVEDGFCAWRAERWEEEQGRIANGQTFSRRTVRCGGVPVIEHWMIHGGGHAWSGGSPEGSYTDATGPDASAEMARFFLAPLGEGDVNSVGISEANG